jgi:osmotically-inducible protein OsmY
MNFLIPVLSLITFTAAGFAADTAKSPPKPRAQLSDLTIEQNIRARFAKSKCAPEKFQVKVQGGVATIEGKTDVIQHKGAATRMAKTGGAIQVINKVQISENARQKSAANLEKGRKKAEVKPL